MKTRVYVVMLLFSIGIAIVSCETENDSYSSNPLVLTGQIVNHSTCKDETKSAFNVLETPDTISCVEYSFDRVNNKLNLKHINAGFNCCPDSLFVETSQSGDTVVIQEFEVNPICRCNCLYDLDIELTGVESKKYLVKFVEPHAMNKQELIFEVDLANVNEGEFCMTRKGFPWGE